MVDLNVVVRSESGRVVRARFAPHTIKRVLEIAEISLPFSARYLITADKARWVGERLQRLLQQSDDDDDDDDFAQAIAALALFFAELNHDGDWFQHELRKHLTAMTVDGWAPTLGISFAQGGSSVMVLSGDHARASEQLRYLTARLAIGGGFIQSE